MGDHHGAKSTTAWFDMGDKTVRAETHTDKVHHTTVETFSKPHCGGCGKCSACVAAPKSGCKDWGWGALLLGFIIIAAVVWLILWLVKPSWILKTNNHHGPHNGQGQNQTGHPNPHPHPQPNGDCDIDPAKMFIAVILISLLVFLFLWLISTVLCNAKC